MQLAKTLNAILGNRDLKKRILLTIGLLLIFRIIAHIPLPGVDVSGLKNFFESNQLVGMLDLLSGGSVSRFSLALLGVGPYITASIVFQLLGMVIPSLEALQKEGEHGRQKINQYTRYAAVPLAFIESFGLIKLLQSQAVVGDLTAFQMLVTMVTATGASMFLMWLGEIISEKGIGNGISMIISLGIIAGLPPSISSLSQLVSGDTTKTIFAIGYGVVILAMISFIIYITEAERRLPVTYARRLRSSSSTTRVDSYLPMKLNAGGVIPIIFASSLLVFPGLIAQLFSNAKSEWLQNAATAVNSFVSNNYYYSGLFFLLVIAFTFFYTSVVVQPDRMAENLQKQGSFIPGLRPGRETSTYIKNVTYRITATGALALALVAVLPFLMQAASPEFKVLSIGGTGILIIVSVALETIRQINSHITTQTYDKFM